MSETIHISQGLYRVMLELIDHYEKHHVPCDDCHKLTTEEINQQLQVNKPENKGMRCHE